MITVHPRTEELLLEPCFELFKHKGLVCCVKRNMLFGNINGYVAVTEGHPLFHKHNTDKVCVPDTSEIKFNGNYIGMLCMIQEEVKSNIISLDMLLNVHYGLTYAEDYLLGIEDNIWGNYGGSALILLTLET